MRLIASPTAVFFREVGMGQFGLVLHMGDATGIEGIPAHLLLLSVRYNSPKGLEPFVKFDNKVVQDLRA